jgi:hypothetical protein
VPFAVPVLLLALAQQVVQVPAQPPRPAAPAQPPRDTVRRAPPPEPVGTASIRGRVVAADSGSPIRRANVSLSIVNPPVSLTSSQPPSGANVITQTVVINGSPVQVNTSVQASGGRPKSMITDAQGMFEFKDLPAGLYRLTANPGQYYAQYLGMSYGAKRPNGPGSNDLGQPIQLADGQSFGATIALPRGAVISGRVTDDGGDPLARIQIYTLLYPAGSTRGQRTGGFAQTDDLGQFRLFGLTPGDYVVVAEGRGNTYVQPNAPPETEEERIGMLTTFYPSTPDEGAAQRIRTRQGGETSGIEIRMSTGRLLHISGMVTDSQGKTSTRVSGQLMNRTSTGAGINNFGFSTDQEGRFQIRNIPPGEYRLVIRQMIQRPPAADSNTPPDPGEFANVPISLAADLDNLLITTGPGVSITGQIVYEGGPPPPLPNGQAPPPLRVFAQQADPYNYLGMGGPQNVSVSPDLTFTMKGMAGEFLLRGSGTNQYLMAVMLGGEDITDTPREFKQGDKVTLVVTTRASTLEGAVTDDRGQPVNDASVMIFGEDKSSWRNNSLRTRRMGPDITGHFRITGLLPGRYFAIAVPRERLNALNYGPVDPSFFEQLAKEATSVTVGADEQRQVDLKVAAGSGG